MVISTSSLVFVAIVGGAAESTTDWQAVGHALEHSWLAWVTRFGPWIFGVSLGFVLGRGLLRARRYRAVDVLTEGERAALRERVAAVETRTDGELVVVVVEASDDHPDACWRAAAATWALGTLLLAGALPYGDPLLHFGAQLVLGALGFVLALSLADFRRSFVRERRASEVAEEQALQELQRLDVAADGSRNAVLLFVSLFEQRVVVLADEAAHAAVHQRGGARSGESAWVDVDEAVLSGFRGGSMERGSLFRGLERGIDAAGAVLSESLPKTGASPSRHGDDVQIRER